MNWLVRFAIVYSALYVFEGGDVFPFNRSRR